MRHTRRNGFELASYCLKLFINLYSQQNAYKLKFMIQNRKEMTVK